MIETMSIRSLCLVVGSLAKIGYTNPEFLYIITNRIHHDSAISAGASIQQLAIILRSLQKMKAGDPIVTRRLIDLMLLRKIDDSIDNRGICNLLTCLSYSNCSEEVLKRICDQTKVAARKFEDSEGVAIMKAAIRIAKNCDDKAYWRILLHAMYKTNTQLESSVLETIDSLEVSIMLLHVAVLHLPIRKFLVTMINHLIVKSHNNAYVR
jgi:hypothetical protein